MEPRVIAAQAVGILTPYLANAAARGTAAAQYVATRVLGDMVAEYIRASGHQREWEQFAGSPRDHGALIRHLLAQSTENDPDFRLRLGAAVRAAAAERTPAGGQSITMGDGQASLRRDTFGDNNRVATEGGQYTEQNVRHQGNVHNTRKNDSGRYVLLALGALVVFFLLLKGVPAVMNSVGGGLDANSSCQKFLDTDEGTEQQAMVDIATSKGLDGFGSPLALPEIRYDCSSAPDATLGSIIEREGNSF